MRAFCFLCILHRSYNVRFYTMCVASAFKKRVLACYNRLYSDISFNKRYILMDIAPGITIDEKVRFGKPVIKGTRVPVDMVIGKLAGGMTYEEVMSEFDLTKEDILAALEYAAKHLSEEEIRAIG